MADIVSLAKAVAEGIEAPAKAEVMFAPDLDLRGMRELRVIVVPFGLGMKPISRGCSEDTLHLQVGVLKKCTEDEVQGLIELLVGIGRSFLDRRILDATCTDVRYEPLYSSEHLRERRQFTGVVELVFKTVYRR